MEAYDGDSRERRADPQRRRLRGDPFGRCQRHQRLNQEAAKAQADGRRMGIEISDAPVDRLVHAQRRQGAWASATRPAASSRARWPMSCCGTAIRCSVYSRPEKVWIDGALLFDALDSKRRPVSDFELGQPGEGDVK